jgi:RNA polymerase sigma-70 factor (ECF subfamily)
LDKEASHTFESLVKENEQLIFKVCSVYAYNAHDRKDLYQDIVLQLWRSFPSFKNNAKFSTWMYRVAINTAITGLRKNNKIQVDATNLDDLHHLHDLKTANEEELLSELYTAISKLNEVEKAIVMLYLEDKSYEEMEDVLGINQGTLRVKMTRIKDKLRNLTKSTVHGT